MKRRPVVLSPEVRVVAATSIQQALTAVHPAQVLAVAVGRVHMHLLARFPLLEGRAAGLARRASAKDDPPRHFLGTAKQWSAKELAARSLVEPGGVWARRGKIVPIRDRRHQLRVCQYVADHLHEGAAVWSFRDNQVMIEQ